MAALWLAACGAARSVADAVMSARRRQAERRHAVLLQIDEADLSEAGQRARREALHALRDARRRGGADSQPPASA